MEPVRLRPLGRSARLASGATAQGPRRPEAPAPAPGGCTVFLARLRDLRVHHAALLDHRETDRRSRFTSEADRDRFTLGAVLLRMAVARSVEGASAVTVSRTCAQCGRQHGRPRLPGSPLHASVSHSGDLVVVATTVAGPVGVDVELVGSAPTPHLLAAVCSSVERAFVGTPQEFFTYWVRKEAVLKATGEGMQREMTDVVVTRPDRPPRLLVIEGAETPTCSMTSITVNGYTGAVAVLAARPVTFTFVDAGATLLDV